MATIIRPRDFLIRLKSADGVAKEVMRSDLLEITELGITIPFSVAVNVSEFLDLLKKAVSDFNADAALSNRSPIDFDDLYTKYSEYVEALKGFISKSD